MRTVYLIPIEPLEERYSASWYKNIPSALHDAQYNVEVIEGDPLTDVIETGSFLDMNSTVAYKSSQMRRIARKFYRNEVKPNSIFFVTDLEFWGIEAIRLLSQINKVPVQIVGFLHAASYTTEDAFSVAEPYQKYTELGWLAAADLVLVGSQYHKRAIIERRIEKYADKKDIPVLSAKISCSGNPLFKSDYAEFPDIQKRKKLILSNRFDYEKRPNISLNIAYILKKRHPDLEIVITTSSRTLRSNAPWLVEYANRLEEDKILTIKDGLTKEEYHRELASSSLFITNSIEENFGYCLVEACIYDVAALAPDYCSHREILNSNLDLLFTSEDDCISKADAILNGKVVSTKPYVERFYKSMDRICDFLMYV